MKSSFLPKYEPKIIILRNLKLQNMNLRKESDNKQIGTVNSQLNKSSKLRHTNSKFMFY